MGASKMVEGLKHLEASECSRFDVSLKRLFLSGRRELWQRMIAPKVTYLRVPCRHRVSDFQGAVLAAQPSPQALLVSCSSVTWLTVCESARIHGVVRIFISTLR